jgi:cytochrome P450
LSLLREDPALIRTGVEELTRYESPLETATASANWDERQFDRPDSPDITRTDNRHLSLEGQLAIHALLRQFPKLKLAVVPERRRWRRGIVLRGLEPLPCVHDN